MKKTAVILIILITAVFSTFAATKPSAIVSVADGWVMAAQYSAKGTLGISSGGLHFPSVGEGLKPSPTIIKGKASWYSQNDPGILLTTANMERFDDSQLTCAIWDLPFNTILKVTNTENGKSVIVRVNDRGPAKRLNRSIDLTKTAFSKIADPEKGLVEVSVEIM